MTFRLASSPYPLMVALIVPFAGALLAGLLGERRQAWRNRLSAVVTFVTMAAAMILALQKNPGRVMIPGVFIGGIGFDASGLGLIMGIMTTLAWFLATLFSIEYMEHESHQTRFYVTLLFTLGTCLGVFFADDMLTLFTFFELMTFSSYILVIHEETPQALEAGNTYLYMGVAGGLCILMGIYALFATTGTMEIPKAFHALANDGDRYLVAIPLITGFAVKAGMVPLHIWLPKAHPVAPSPASALLSGIMIKTGAYGIAITLLNTFVLPPHGSGYTMGQVVMWMGILTMLVGAALALVRTNLKVMLAYSSVSQMGYILTALGAAVILGSHHGALGFSGAVYHVMNHSIFKSGLFVVAGLIYLRKHTLDIRNLGGLLGEMPYAAFGLFVASLAVSGIPGFSGFPSKTFIHDAILEICYESHSFWAIAAEKLFLAGSTGTAMYFMKICLSMFRSSSDVGNTAVGNTANESSLSRFLMLVYIIVITATGVFPNFVPSRLLAAASASQGFDSHFAQELGHFEFFEWKNVSPVILSTLVAACLFCFSRKLVEHPHLPGWLSVEAALYRPVCRLGLIACYLSKDWIDDGLNMCYLGFIGILRRAVSLAWVTDLWLNAAYESSSRMTLGVLSRMASVERAIDGFYEWVSRTVKRAFKPVSTFDKGLEEAYFHSSMGRRAVKRVEKADAAVDRAYSRFAEYIRRHLSWAYRLDKGLDTAYEEGTRAASYIVKRAARTDDSIREKIQPLAHERLGPKVLIAGIILMILILTMILIGLKPAA